MRPSNVRHGRAWRCVLMLSITVIVFSAPAASELLPDGSSSFMKAKESLRSSSPGSRLAASEDDAGGLVASSVYQELLAPRSGTNFPQEPIDVNEILTGPSSWRSLSAREYFGKTLYANEPSIVPDLAIAEHSVPASSEFPSSLLVVVLSVISLGIGIWAWDRQKRDELYESFIETHP